jgi:glutathione S-transferase
MKYFNSIGPNPGVVNMFMAEKGIQIPTEQVDLMAGHNRQEPYLSKNPAGQMPALELDDGVVLCEILPICEYLDETHPNPPLIGSNAEERAITRMWTRRIDLNICEPMANGFRFGEGLQLFQNRIRTIPEASSGLKETAKEKLAWIDGLVAGRQWIVGDRFTLADILLYVFVEFGAQVGQPLDPANKNLAAWKDRVAARSKAPASAAATA